MEIKLPQIDQTELDKIKKDKYKEIISDSEIVEFINHYELTEKEIIDNLYYFSLYH